MLYAPGTLMYLYHRKKEGKKLFNTTTDLVICVCLLAAFVFAVYATATGMIQPF